MSIHFLKNGLGIREMEYKDIAAIRLIEQVVHITPWSENGFKTSLDSGYHCWVVVNNHQNVIAYIIFMEVLQEEFHILNIAVHPDMHRQGIGGWLLQCVLKFALEKKVDAVLLEVRASNLAAQQLYDKYQFQQIGIRKDYYRTATGRENALFLQRSMGSSL